MLMYQGLFWLTLMYCLFELPELPRFILAYVDVSRFILAYVDVLFI